MFRYPVPTTSLFAPQGFNHAMLLFSPIMAMHVFGVIFFSQSNGRVSAEKLPENKSLRSSIHAMTHDLKVRIFSQYIYINIPIGPIVPNNFGSENTAVFSTLRVSKIHVVGNTIDMEISYMSMGNTKQSGLIAM